MADTPQRAMARYEPGMGWREPRRRPGSPNPFGVRRMRDAVRFDDDDSVSRTPPMTRRWTGANEDNDDPGFGLVLAAVAVVLVVVLLIAVTLWI